MVHQLALLNRCRAFQPAAAPRCKQVPRLSSSRRGSSATCSAVALDAECSRRAALVLPTVAGAVSLLSTIAPPHAQAANALSDLTRRVLRPEDITPEQAAVVFLDARSVLREIATLAATAPDSMERFRARKEWPGYAKWLRLVGPAAPVLAAVAAGKESSEATLSEDYGGTGGSSGVADEVYISLGRVLTISGRTIKDEAQVDPSIAQAAGTAVQNVLDRVPKDLLEKAQQYRIARAGGK